MATKRKQGPGAILERMHQALNHHDIDAFVSCFSPDYDSEQPVYPDRTFHGNEQVRKNWSAFFADVPDLKVEFPRSAVEGNAVWVEMHYLGTTVDRKAFEMWGVAILDIEEGLIRRGRLHMHPVVQSGKGIDAAIEELTHKTPGQKHE